MAMNGFEILEIAPTTDIRTIKKAYARMAAKYHPEDDAAMFQRINAAYKMALQYAQAEPRPVVFEPAAPEAGAPGEDVFAQPETAVEEPAALASESAEFEFPEISAAPAKEEVPENDPAFDFSQLQEAASKQAAAGGAKPSPWSSPEAFGGGVDISRSAQRIFEQLQLLYYDGSAKNSSGAWDRIFASPAFKKEMDNPIFTNWVLDFLLQHREISGHIWNGTILPVLQAWGKRFTGTTYEELQGKLRQLMVPAKTTEWSLPSLKTILSVLVVALVILAALARLYRIFNTFAHMEEKQNPTWTFMTGNRQAGRGGDPITDLIIQ